VAIAGLCHDLGHGPYSHLFDGPFLSKILPANHSFTHEAASTMLFNQMLEENSHIVVKARSKEADFIMNLIEGEPDKCPEEKRFLFDIVSNSRNSIDVDKIDYIQRDCRCLNVSPYISFNSKLVIEGMRVINNQICFPIKRCYEVNKIFKSRFNLHHDCYNHKTIHAYELMICDALLLTHKVLYDYEAAIADPSLYLRLDDNIIDEIVTSEDPRLDKAKAIIERIQMRGHYRCVGEKGLRRQVAEQLWNSISAEEIVSHLGAQSERAGDPVTLTADEIGVKKFLINHGMKRGHPLENVKFFNLKGPTPDLAFGLE